MSADITMVLIEREGEGVVSTTKLLLYMSITRKGDAATCRDIPLAFNGIEARFLWVLVLVLVLVPVSVSLSPSQLHKHVTL